MQKELEKIGKIVGERLQKHKLKGRTITLKIKFSDFKIITRSHSLPEPVDDIVIITQTAIHLMLASYLESYRIRLLGITVSNFSEVSSPQRPENLSGQLILFGE
jgi:DNA polymerase-4